VTGFVAGIGGKLAERWLLLILTPAFAFWGGGVAAWAWGRGWSDGWTELGNWIKRLSSAEQIALAVGAFILVSVSGVVVQRITLPMLRLLEGYWPGWLDPVSGWVIGLGAPRIARLQRERDKLAARLDEGHASASEQRRHLALDRRLRRIPTEANDDVLVRRMPTALGNVLRSSESWPADKYGLDAVKCWARLWLVLPDATRSELTSARTLVDATASVVTWALLFVVCTFWAWWAAPIGLLVAGVSYRMLVSSAAAYGDLVEAAFDIHWRLLYEALEWPQPRTPAEQKAFGEALTEYLWRGSDATTPTFTSD